jgi:hypothetical protein
VARSYRREEARCRHLPRFSVELGTNCSQPGHRSTKSKELCNARNIYCIKPHIIDNIFLQR